jgi:cystathionine beta-lyase/cystathionine gamma-synthase
MTQRNYRIETEVIHAGEPEKVNGAVVLPIFQTSTYQYGGESRYQDVRYIRLNNTPNHLALHGKLASLEKAESALVTSSGMAAITTALLTILKPGDHLLAQDCLYGGTHDLLTHEFLDFGIKVSFIDGQDPASWAEHICTETKAIMVESISNPLMKVPELDEVVSFSRKNGLVSLIDNTFATPVNLRPIELGFDVVLHSCTKYLNGHSDMVAGAIIGKESLLSEMNLRLLHLGGTLDPHACFLLHRGLKTLVLRVRYQNESAKQIAGFLNQHPKIKQVNYPGISNQKRGSLRHFGGYGGMISFTIDGGMESTSRFLSALELAVEAPSLGGPETLITRPSTTSHSGLSPEDRAALGISDGLIRMSVGLEGTPDLIEDLENALKTV